jgi:hypothetical protein
MNRRDCQALSGEARRNFLAGAWVGVVRRDAKATSAYIALCPAGDRSEAARGRGGYAAFDCHAS